MVFAMEQEQQPDDPAQHDVNNEAFWGGIEAMLDDTKALILALAEEQGIDLASLDLEAIGKEDERLREEAAAHDLTRAANEYAEMVTQWVEAEAKPKERRQRKTEPVASEESDTVDTADIIDATEVLRWYQHQIGVKIARALVGSAREDQREEVEWQKDSDGSIKVALIGIDRSMAAWGLLLNEFGDRVTNISPILLHLERLRRMTEQTFPNARNFVRPGFDEAPTDFVS